MTADYAALAGAVALAVCCNLRCDPEQLRCIFQHRYIRRRPANNPRETPMMTNLVPARAYIAILLLGMSPAAVAAAERSLGENACTALSGAGTGSTRIDSAALTEAKPLTVAPGG